jgi:antitoxin component YwqK of YwqJK toxin-antitoxin module
VTGPRIDYDRLDLDDELASLDGVPFTGVVYSLHRDGSLESEGPYRDGLPEGVQEQWHPGGQIYMPDRPGSFRHPGRRVSAGRADRTWWSR